MRRAATLLTLLVVLTATGCTDEPEPSSFPTPTGPCAKTRALPPDGSQEQRQQGDLDGDGKVDEVVSWMQDGERVVQAWLATGENADPEALFDGDLLATGDIDGDGRAEVFASTGATTGTAFVLDECRLKPIGVAGTDRQWEYAVGPGAALICRPRGIVEEAVTQGPESIRRAWTLAAGEVTGANPVGSGPVTEPGISCG